MTAIPLSAAQPPFILVVDIGTSSLRALVFDGRARAVEGLLARRPHEAHITPDGGADLDAAALLDAFASALDEVMSKARAVEIAGVATSSLAASVLGVDEQGQPLTPAYLYSDTRDANAVEALRSEVDWTPIYARTGCPLHTGYLPARLWWLREQEPTLYRRAAHWISLHEFMLLKLFGRAVISHSLASWTGLLDREELAWDQELLQMLDLQPEQFSPLVSARTTLNEPGLAFRTRWPGLAAASFFPAIGDGATANIGSGCADTSRVALTIGTSGAVRVVLPVPGPQPIPSGLWVYSVDERRALLGGSLNNGGNVYAYLARTLRLPEDQVEDQELARVPPDGHGLTVLPFFAGERSPGYHGNARAAIVGLSLDSLPIHILRATLEGIAFRVAAIYQLLVGAIPGPQSIIASGSALLHSPTWAQILADVLGQGVTVSGEQEASARGAALLALEALGSVHDAADVPTTYGPTYSPNPANHQVYLRARARQQRLYTCIVERGCS